MVVRGRLAFDDQGRLVEIAEDAADPTNPQPSEIEPVEFEQLIAQTAAVQNLDAGQLVSALDAAGYDLNNVGALDAQEVSTEEQQLDTPGVSNWSSGPLTQLGAARSDVLSTDTAATFYNQQLTNFAGYLILDRAGTVTSAHFNGSADSSSDAQIVVQGGGDTIEATTSDVTGTSGTDGVFTLSVQDGLIKVENRLGTSVFVTIILFGGNQ